MYSNFKQKSGKIPFWQYVLVVSLALAVLVMSLLCFVPEKEEQTISLQTVVKDNKNSVYLATSYIYFDPIWYTCPFATSATASVNNGGIFHTFAFRPSLVKNSDGTYGFLLNGRLSGNSRSYFPCLVYNITSNMPHMGIMKYNVLGTGDWTSISGTVPYLISSFDVWQAYFLYYPSDTIGDIAANSGYQLYCRLQSGFDFTKVVRVVAATSANLFSDSSTEISSAAWNMNTKWVSWTYYDVSANTFVFALPVYGFSQQSSLSFDYDYWYTTAVTDNNIYQQGYSTGYAIGNSEGMAAGSQESFNAGYTAGKTQGFNQGYQEGVESANNYTFFSLISAVIDAPIKAFSGLLDFNVFGYNMKNFYLSLITVCIIIAILKAVT